MSTCQSKSSTMLFFFVAAGCLLAVQSQNLFLFGCPSVSVMSPFDICRYSGEWYENRKYFATFEAGQKCIKAQYTLNDNGTVEVQNSGIKISNGEVVSITGKAAVTEADTGNLVVAFDNLDSKFIINYLLPNCIKLLFFYQISRLLLTIWCLALTTTRTLSFGVVPTSGFSTRN